MQETLYLWYLVEKGWIQTQKDKTEALRRAPFPTIKKQVQAFLSLASYY